MTREKILEKVTKAVVDKLGVEESKVTMEAEFMKDLGADSLDTVELIMKLEDEFGIKIPEEEGQELTTVGKAIDYIESKLQNN